MCVTVCDLETPTMRWPRSELGCCSTAKYEMTQSSLPNRGYVIKYKKIKKQESEKQKKT